MSQNPWMKKEQNKRKCVYILNKKKMGMKKMEMQNLEQKRDCEGRIPEGMSRRLQMEK